MMKFKIDGHTVTFKPEQSIYDIVKELGTRHRAAVGITEVSDCVVVVVSEERHVISVANNGAIKGDYHIGPAELYGEDTLKAIQNTLLNDLFLLLAGTPYDENGKPAKSDRRFRMNLKFMWGWGDAKKKSAASVDMPLSAASPKSEASSSDGGETGQNP